MKVSALRSADRAIYIIATILVSAFLAYAQAGPPSTAEQKPALGTAPVDPNRYQPDTGAYGQVGIEEFSDPQGVDIRPYVFLDLLPHINDKWHELFPQVTSPPVMKKGKVAIEFAIAKDGSVHSMRMIKSSNDAALDFAAWAAIAASNPFPPLPAELKSEDLAFRLSFDYNPDPGDIALTPPINDILRKHHENLSKDKNARVDLENDVRALSSVLNNGHLETKNEIAARFYRGIAINYLGALGFDQGQPVDLAMAKEALLDFDRVIDSNTEVAGWLNTRTEATFEAGQIAHQIRSTTLAYSYWSTCAQEGDAACVMRVATAHVTGEGGITVDFGKALDLYKKAFDTNAGYRCVGAHSALSIAAVVYFTGTRSTSFDDPLAWVQKSYGFSDPVEKSDNKNFCGGADARIQEFLYRLSAGERRDDLLKQATERLDDDSPETRALLNYFSGLIDETGFGTEVEATKSEASRCYAYFHGMWYAEITKRQVAAQRYYDRLSEVGKYWCSAQLVFAKKFHN